MEFYIGKDDIFKKDKAELLEVKVIKDGTNPNHVVSTDKYDSSGDITVFDTIPTPSENPSKIPFYKIMFYGFLVFFAILHIILVFALIYDFEHAQKFSFYLILGWILIAYIKVIID
uniref:Uncharacterized protein n=1 Tax=Panagrolaimus sp. PS1159 TaxID=55785 RepID=A0AC35FPJ2_9BILA